ncbi:MAG TPA: hypothetical protein VLV55_04885 [Rhizomicrobium sp.]|nr:hypothetical protein [Rhizomicrobium sp.]
MSQVEIRLRQGRYELLAKMDGTTRVVGRISRDGLVYEPKDELQSLGREIAAEANEKAASIQEVHRAETGMLIVNALRLLDELQNSLSLNGPGDATVLLQPLEAALASTLRKVRRVNELTPKT